MPLVQQFMQEVGLPYPDPMHPVAVHFVIAMVLFAVFCDIVGYFSRSHRWFEVSFWNMTIASVAIFISIILGQFEAGLADTYPAMKPILTRHQIMGWSLAAIVVAVTAWKFILRSRSQFRMPPLYLGVATFLVMTIVIQVYLGTALVWEFGIHVESVVQAIRQGVVQ